MSNNAMKTVKMIEIWHEMNGFNATYHHLIDVCLDLRHVSLAERVCGIVKGECTCYETNNKIKGSVLPKQEIFH